MNCKSCGSNVSDGEDNWNHCPFCADDLNWSEQ